MQKRLLNGIEMQSIISHRGTSAAFIGFVVRQDQVAGFTRVATRLFAEIHFIRLSANFEVNGHTL